MRMLSASLFFLAASVAFPQAALQQAPVSTPPATPQHPVFDTYFNVKVQDNYRWLEDGSSPEVKQWVTAQNDYTAAYMDRLPDRNRILDELKQRMDEAHTVYTAFQVVQDHLFALRFDPGKPAPRLVSFDSPENMQSERVIFDAATFDPNTIFQIDWYRISPDGHLSGIAVSTGGSEDASLYVIDNNSGQQLGETVPRVNFATGGGDMAWNADSTGFYYTRYPQGHERPAEDMDFYQQVYFHDLAQLPSHDRYIIGKDFPRIAEITFAPSPDHSRLIISVANGDGGQFEHFLVTPDGKIHPITQFSDKIVDAVFGQDNSIWLLSRRNSNMGEILHLPATDTRLAHATLVVPAADAAIEGTGTIPGRIYVSADRLYLIVIHGGPEEIRAYSLTGQRLPDVKTPPVASISELVPDGPQAFLFGAATYTTPQQWYRVAATGDPVALPFHTITNIKMDDIDVERVFAASKDGTRIPMTILMRKGTKLDGSSPAFITGYGGFGISITPSFAGASRSLFDHGFVVAIANIRGGGEFGEDWHQAGMLAHKQNVFDDFAACAQYLVDHQYTSSSRLAAEGGSNGGLLMGAMITQRPQLFRAIVSFVGIYDMLRNELDPNGSFNITEYGTVQNRDQFLALFAYSPYHHVQSGTPYPAVLFITGDNDHRVNPANSRKMTAALQAASSSKLPVLLLTNASAGHGLSTNVSQALLEQADAQAFLFSILHVPMQ